MKIDYKLLKKILTALEDNENFEMRTNELIEKLSDVDCSQDKFIGHLYELNDNGCFDCPKPNLGFTRRRDGYSSVDSFIRLTSQGRQFLDMLNNDTVFNKIKTFSVGTAIETGRALLQAIVTNAIR